VDAPLVLGVDAGSARVAVVLAELAEARPQVIGVGLVPCTGVRRGVVVDMEATARAIRAAVSQACDMAGRSQATRAVLSISGPHIQSTLGIAEIPVHRPSRGVTPEDVRKVLDTAAQLELPAGREVIHLVPRGYAVDGADGVSDPVGLLGRRLEGTVHLIIGDSLPVQNALRTASAAGLKVIDYQLAVRAAGQAVLTPEERQAGVLLVDFGAQTTGVAVYDRGHLLHTGLLDIGSDQITHDLARTLSLPGSVAEELKTQRGWAATDLCPDDRFELVSPSGQRVRQLTDKQIAAIIEPHVQGLLREVAAEVRRSRYQGLFPGGLVLTGGGSRLQGLAATAADGLALPARIGVAPDPLAGQPEFATAAGLVMWGARLVQEVAAAAGPRSTEKRSRLRNWFGRLFR